MHPTADAPQSPRAWGELTIGVRTGQWLSQVDSQSQWCCSLCRAINTPPSGVKTWATPPAGGAGLVDSAVCRESSDRRPFKRAECTAGSGHQTIQTVKKEAGILSTALKYFTRPSTHLRDLTLGLLATSFPYRCRRFSVGTPLAPSRPPPASRPPPGAPQPPGALPKYS